MGKAAGRLSRLLRLGGGTSFPGMLARRLSPNVLHELASALPNGVLLLSGTNGKTTTTRMIAGILQASGLDVLHNRAGANLVEGLTTAALNHTTIFGVPQATIGLFETDEAALPAALAETQPCLVVIHNLFRDQLDRYGEVDTIAQTWRTALQTLPSTTTVLLNADDPAVAYLGDTLAAQVVYYGLEDASHASGASSHTADSQCCRRCGTRYDYALAFYGHIGHYTCPACRHSRPTPHIRLAQLRLHGAESSQLFITYEGGAMEIHLPLPGLYNALNALAATATGLVLNIPPIIIRHELEQFRAAFGRIERVQADKDGASMLIALIKNPVGASETVRMLLESDSPESQAVHVLIAINDLYADGTDVSWLWDADFEPLVPYAAHVTVSGTRAADMAVRLKYAGISPDALLLEPDLSQAIDLALQRLPPNTTLFVLPTYTAMLNLRDDLVHRGWVRPFWEQ